MSQMILYAVRHGRSTGNDQRIFQGRRDFPLCPTGRAQAEATARFLRDVRFDHAYVSPLSRAQETLAPILQGHPMPVTVDERLTEMDVGDWSGHSFSWIIQNDPEGVCCWNEHPDEHIFPRGESMAQAYARINSAVDDIARAHPDGTILMVTHGGVLRCLWARVTEGNLRAVRNGAVFANASVSAFICEDGKWSVSFVNRTEQIPAILLSKKIEYRL